MADGVTNLAAGWNEAGEGTAERALGGLISAGNLTGEAIVQALIARGNTSRGPAYYPEKDGAGPFYALGNPHTYAALVVPSRDAWELIGPVASAPQTDTAPAEPAPTPTPTPDDFAAIMARLDALETKFTDLLAAFRNDTDAAFAELSAQCSIHTEDISRQINTVVKNAEISMRALEPIVEAALPALAGLFGKHA